MGFICFTGTETGFRGRVISSFRAPQAGVAHEEVTQRSRSSTERTEFWATDPKRRKVRAGLAARTPRRSRILMLCFSNVGKLKWRAFLRGPIEIIEMAAAFAVGFSAPRKVLGFESDFFEMAGFWLRLLPKGGTPYVAVGRRVGRVFQRVADGSSTGVRRLDRRVVDGFKRLAISGSDGFGRLAARVRVF
jgi:hypothetical protein